MCAYKPNTAFYEGQGVEGLVHLKNTIDYLKKSHPEIPIILDAKRGDIENTNQGYISFAFNYLGADALTLHPYMGRKSLLPFFELKDKMFFILCRTSNDGASEFQDLTVGDKLLYEIVAEKAAREWNTNDNCGLVVGATHPDEIRSVRKIVGDMPLLIPGIGAQGGDIEKTVRYGVDSQGENAIINASRSIIFSENPKEEAIKLRDEINKFR